MHLKTLKLAGFKSFVDPTSLHFSSQLVGVVGPNGCGKSNIIDAVRWVMGESSARHLRGECMADVIFNGSTERKPLGQASVELIFDNSLGRLVGPFSTYTEIVVKRVVTRSGESFYSLNGLRCRRRDVVDLFLGTGAGTRGYSIIGQGTVAQLVEAKPDDLRIFLEEAAGVSKYKERRRETLQRIQATRDNLARVSDIREELAKQLQRLERQAKVAQRYQHLKEQEKLCKAEILALKWQEFSRQQTVKQQELSEHACRHEELQALMTHANLERLRLTEQLDSANDKSEDIQAHFYQLSTEIARREENIQQQERERKRLEQDIEQLQKDRFQAMTGLQEAKEELTYQSETAQAVDQELALLREELAHKQTQWQNTTREQTLWDAKQQEMQATINSLKREQQVNQVNCNHSETKREQLNARLEKLLKEQTMLSIAELQLCKNELELKQQYSLKQLQQDEDETNGLSDKVNQLRHELQQLSQQLQQYQDQFHTVNSQHAALMAAQRALKGPPQPQGEKLRLMDLLQVDVKWQQACEHLLSESFSAVVVDELNLEQQESNAVTLRPLKTSSAAFPRLAQQIKSLIPASMVYLEAIYTANDKTEAAAWLPKLLDYESIVTPEGIWMGKGWIKYPNLVEESQGVLARQQQIQVLSEQVKELKQKIEVLCQCRDQEQDQLQAQEKKLEQSRLQLTASSKTLHANTLALNNAEQALAQMQHNAQKLAQEIVQLQQNLEESLNELQVIQDKQKQLTMQCTEFNEQYSAFLIDKESKATLLTLEKEALEACQQRVHQAERAFDKATTTKDQLQTRICREEDHLERMQGRVEQLTQHLQQTQLAQELKEQLTELINQHLTMESQLSSAREEANQLRKNLSNLSHALSTQDDAIKKSHEQIAEIKMQEQALTLKANSLQELLQESDFQAQTVLETIPAEINVRQREEELLALTARIKGLGAINLAAIEEFSVDQERKHYLDEQHDDLSQALTTLETAIEKIDKETHLRLENTFDAVNTGFKALFPRLFGGGRAQLELTCDNLLEAGIMVMAQPPGKKNSTIHLLSGGEKAMTAVALLFAIFQLNPSPFCMLDEVDAPLDDANVGRFCDLVKEMSQCVQFLFITHNKVTMELAENLIGVTMREPGVSRLVTVDVKHALALG